MPPSIHNNDTTTTSTANDNNDYLMVDGRNDAPSRFVTLAVNYELSRIHSFLDSSRKLRQSESRMNVENDLPNNNNNNNGDLSSETTTTSAQDVAWSDTETRNQPEEEPTENRTTTDECRQVQTPPRGNSDMRRSAREKRETPANKSRVRYDMQLVPPARRHRAFLDCFPPWWLPADIATAVEGKSFRRSLRRDGESFPACAHCQGASSLTPTPFAEDTSVLWIPKNRSEWEDTVSELTAVCTSAAIRRFHAEELESNNNKAFHPPLSTDYIRDRVDIDDPLHGYQLRHKAGGWLQGFILWTNFTTWTHNFHWDSMHVLCGLDPSEARRDVDGSLAEELEKEERAGDPLGGGIVFPTVAEIALVGGLACGEYMLRMAMEDIRAAGTYRFVVLQSTDQSKAFYERFGFVRVGAVCQYGLPKDDGTEYPVMGYRHWTHANESDKSLQMHGGPSYMMCLKLPEKNIDLEPCQQCGRPAFHSTQTDFMTAMMSLQVDEKPTVEQLGGSFSPGPRPRRINTSGSFSGDAITGSYKASRKPPTAPQASPKLGKRKYLTKSLPSKRRKLNGSAENVALDQLMNPPSPGANLSFAQKQYHSVWLAVAPADKKIDGRHGPRDRSGKAATPVGVTSVAAGDRPFYSVRGNNGRFSTISGVPRVDLTKLPPKPNLAVIKPIAAPAPKAKDDSNRNLGFGSPDGKPIFINRHELMKQKVASYPRSRIHFYNRVVKPLKGPTKYFFVVHYDDTNGMMRIAPLEARGRLTGKREGRLRYQVALQNTDANFMTVHSSKYVVVASTMVMKTPMLANEAWDVEDD